MTIKNKLLAVGAICLGLLLPVQAMAAYIAHTRVDLNVRVGPGTAYGVIDVVPAGYPVEVIGCLDGYDWCDIEWEGLRGWVAAIYLVQPGTSVYLPQFAPVVGLPIVAFSFTIYHDRHYRGRPWHRHRHWAGKWRDRREAKRDERRDEKADRPRKRVEQRQERRRAVQREQRRVEQQRQKRRVEQRQERRRAVQREQRPRVEQRQQRRIEQQQRRVEQRQGRQRALQRQRGPRAEQRRGGQRVQQRQQRRIERRRGGN